jgi:GT2 family glycosyltransferase
MNTNVFCLVVTYNGSKWIEKCFGSLHQSSIPLKIIAIDNASSDDTITLIENKFPAVEVIEAGSNLGFGQANNIGLKMALKENADYVFLLNQDAWIENNTVEELFKTAKKNPEYGILSPIHLNATGTKFEQQFSEIISTRNNTSFLSDTFLNNSQPLYELQYIHAAAWFLSKECIETTGGFDPLYYHYGEDDDYLQRAKYFKFKIGLVPSSVIIHDCVYNSWEKVEWDKNRNMIIEYHLLKKMSPHFRTNLLAFFKTGFDELTTLLLYRKFKKFRFRFSILFTAISNLRKVKRSFKTSFKRGAFLKQ